MTARTTQKKDKGFTLVETIVALSISLIIVLGMAQVFTSGIRHMYSIRADTRLAANAEYLVQSLTYEVHRAQGFYFPVIDSPKATIERHDGTLYDIELPGGETVVKIDTSPITTDEVQVTELKFTTVGNSLRIEFTLELKQSVVRTFSGTTTIALRN